MIKVRSIFMERSTIIHEYNDYLLGNINNLPSLTFYQKSYTLSDEKLVLMIFRYVFEYLLEWTDRKSVV